MRKGAHLVGLSHVYLFSVPHYCSLASSTSCV